MKTLKYLLTAVFVTTLLFNCGGDKKKEAPKEKIKLGTKKEEKKVDGNVANLVIAGTDAMQFDKKELRVKAGQKVKLTLRHTGKMDVNVMGHNVVILKQGVDISAFAGKAATARDTKYIPAGAEGDIIAYTNMIGGGQTTSIEFDAPAPGTYDFICSFPGHYALMKGKFIVEQ
ncbi:azurin [Hyunsoonleella sp. SJ7]|uniref:Azurin n=1 Tax=Hyunsoonleella aquatilis TaxID=2762758 RepID=A0A923KGD4_9FLAO|nr:azurin [Hyunsoonleella aquatilis]MBC3758046.1 azurin [Hyunsoonleella aquatilis]